MSKNPMPISGDRGALARVSGRLLAAAGIVAMLTGCNVRDQEVTGSLPDDYRLHHPITIAEATRTVEIFVGTSRGELVASQRADVLAFAQAWRREATGGIIIDLPGGTANELAGTEAGREIRSILAAAGVPERGIDVRSYHPADALKLATIKLSYPRIAATAGPCGLWPKDLGPSFDREYNENNTYWNLGCASQRNLAAMVENPADLVQPRGDAPTYTARRTVVLDKYRKGEATGTNYPGTYQEDPRLTQLGK
jgi:pilus assembly protein CpaD